MEGIIFDPYSAENYRAAAYDDVISQTISSLQQTVEDLLISVKKVLFVSNMKGLHIERVINREILFISILINILAIMTSAEEGE